ncbi:MAG: TRAP transporter small permease [Deltaproteobacteria bacterium]|nr:TRAP transporter small permease [Deltaproteobacteria bacterium]
MNIFINIDKTITKISRIFNIIGMLFLIAMMLLTVSDVLLRLIFNHPILGSTELTEFMMVALSFGMGWCLLEGKVIRMTLVVDRLTPRVQAVINSLLYSLGFIVLLILSWRTVLESFELHRMHSVSAILHIPHYPFYDAVAFSFALLSVCALIVVVRNVVKVIKP